MNKIEISIKKLNGVVLPQNGKKVSDGIKVATVIAEAMNVGYIFAEHAEVYLSYLSENELIDIVNCLKSLKGDDVKYKPMYPNFPQQVMDASHYELYMNAFLHYWSEGEWMPDYKKLPRKFAFDSVTFRELKFLCDYDFDNLFTRLLSSNDSISDYDKKVVEWFIDNHSTLAYPKNIPHKETMCVVAGMAFNKGQIFGDLLKTTTDVLRFVTYLSDGDVSLAKNTKFKSLPRKVRKIICEILEKVITEEDVQRHRNKWCRLFHNLHVGEYSKKILVIASKVRGNKRLETTLGKVQEHINNKDFVKASDILSSRPGEFARSLDFLLRSASTKLSREKILINFRNVISKISTKVLMQLKGHFKNRNKCGQRVVFPKGNTQKAKIIPSYESKIDNTIVGMVNMAIIKELEDRFKNLPSLGKVYIDESLKGCPLPTQQRSASEGIDIVARGTRLPIGEKDKNTVRFFVYWKGKDIDLSASFHDEDFNMIDQITYYNLKSITLGACHSGDITNAPRGASEFIDIDMEKALDNGVRYVIMNVMVYYGQNFSEHEICYAGWMLREKPKSKEIYDPKTVVNKIDLRSESTNVVPMIIDLKTKEIIWVDLVTNGSQFDTGHYGTSGNNVESNKASIQDVLKAITSLDNKSTLHDLLTIHGDARGEIVDDEEEADIVYTVTFAKNINEINSDYLV